MKLALVHDFLNQMGGAEQVVKTFRELFPDAPIYTSIYDENAVCPSFRSADIRTSFMQKLPFKKKHARKFLPLYPYAFEQFDFSDFDLVLSSSSSFAKGILTPPDVCHICYCYTPMRFAWNYSTYIQQEPVPLWAKPFLPHMIHNLRNWDVTTANRVDHFIAISREVSRRIRKCYRREATIIRPPVDTSRFSVGTRDDGYYLIVSRLLPYKRIDIVVAAFSKLGLPLKIVGDGRDMQRLQALAGPSVEFLGRLPDDEMIRCMENCRALIFPGLEDFGLTPVEAMACGKPVIAFAAGGALDTVVDGTTGCFFHEQTPESVDSAVRSFDVDNYDPWRIRRHAECFDVSIFKDEISRFVKSRYELHNSETLSAGEDDRSIPPFGNFQRTESLSGQEANACRNTSGEHETGELP